MSKIKAVVLPDPHTAEAVYWTVPYLKQLIRTSDVVAVKAMLRVYTYQTGDERATDNTRHVNDMGFNGPDAPFLSSICRRYQQAEKQRAGTGMKALSRKQLDKVREKMEKYAKQVHGYMMLTHPDKIQDVEAPKEISNPTLL